MVCGEHFGWTKSVKAMAVEALRVIDPDFSGLGRGLADERVIDGGGGEKATRGVSGTAESGSSLGGCLRGEHF